MNSTGNDKEALDRAVDSLFDNAEELSGSSAGHARRRADEELLLLAAETNKQADETQSQGSEQLLELTKNNAVRDNNNVNPIELLQEIQDVTAQESLVRLDDLTVIKIRNSDRTNFRRCRRRWNWQWSHRGNLEAITRADPLWQGSGFHFAMEDFHSYRRWEHPADAFREYTRSWLAANRRHNEGFRIPDNWEEMTEQSCSMLNYYEYWLQSRESLNTFVYKGRFQTEVNFQIQLPITDEWLQKVGASRIVASGTIDRVVIDSYGRLWLVDYKTAKVASQDHLDIDPQITMYLWAAQYLYPGYTVGGFIYQQHKKLEIEEPPFVKSTRRFSTDKRLATTAVMYEKTLTNFYGHYEKAPSVNIEYLQWLKEQENGEKDRFIIRTAATRNASQLLAEERKLVMEAYDMTNPELRLYPNPTRDCNWDCKAFYDACLMLDDGGDAAGYVEGSTVSREEESELWLKELRLPKPTRLPEILSQEQQELLEKGLIWQPEEYGTKPQYY